MACAWPSRSWLRARLELDLGDLCGSREAHRGTPVPGPGADVDLGRSEVMKAPHHRLLQTNGCSDQTTPIDPSPCVAYQGCQEGYPVIWCEQEGVGHAIPSYGSTTIAEFFQQF